jgi:alpha-beta hydrolase superfamily lysophospholipase
MLRSVWFGEEHAELAGTLHVPRDAITGGVVICPPFGYEATCAHRSLRLLADRLAGSGDLVLRFDYTGTGSSSGDGRGSHLLDRWTENVLSAVDELRSRGIKRPALVGLRLGGALACQAAANDAELGPIVLWSPISSGARYQRELRALSALNKWSARDDGSLNVAGHHISAELRSELRAWSPLEATPTSVEMLLVESPGWHDADAARSALAVAGGSPTVLEVAGTSEVLENDAEMVCPPQPLLQDIARWLAKRPQQPAVEVNGSPDDRRVRIAHGSRGTTREEFVEIGPAGLHGVLTQPVESPPRRGVLFLNNGTESCSGPGRAWTTFARALVADDVTTLRMDLSGLGNSPDLGGRTKRPDNPTPLMSARDLQAGVDFLRRRGVQDLTVVGLCSGAHIAVRSAAYGVPVESVVAVNAPLCSLRDIGVGSPMRHLWRQLAFLSEKRPGRAALNFVSERIWTVLDRIGLFPSPYRYLRLAANSGCKIVLVYAEGDRGLSDIEARAGRHVHNLVGTGRVSLNVVPGMDHSLFNEDSQATVFTYLRSRLSPGPR